MGCGTFILKLVLFVLNVIFLISGIVLLSAGIIILVNSSFLNINDFIGEGDFGRNVALVSIILGSLMTLISFFGTCGACCGNVCMLKTFSTLLGLTICVQLGFGLFLLIEDSWLEGTVETGLNNFVQNDYMGATEDAISEQWDKLQIETECCGVNGPGDWITSEWYNTTDTQGYMWPKTCCKLNNDDPKNPDVTDPAACIAGLDSALYQRGCYEDIKDFLTTWNLAIALAVMATCIFPAIMIVFSCCLSSAAKKDKQVDQVNLELV